MVLAQESNSFQNELHLPRNELHVPPLEFGCAVNAVRIDPIA
jgi:hypothetical protein